VLPEPKEAEPEKKDAPPKKEENKELPAPPNPIEGAPPAGPPIMPPAASVDPERPLKGVVVLLKPVVRDD
jgi:hypothetical protein